MFSFRTLLLLSVKQNQRRHLKYRKQRASWSQTQIVPVLLNSTARLMKPTRSTQKLSSSFRVLKTSMCPFHSKTEFKLSALNDIYTQLTTATHLSFRLKNSNQLEASIQNVKTSLSGFENKLAREEVAPADITSLEKMQRELGVRTPFILCHVL